MYLKNLLKIIICALMFLTVIVVFQTIKLNNENNNVEEANLVIYGDNISTNYSPFVDEGGLYVSVDTISKTVDDTIFYDKVAKKIIITTYDSVYKYKINEKKVSKNAQFLDITTSAKLVNDIAYIDINLLRDVYNVKCEYNEETNTISVDKKNIEDVSVKYNQVKVYSDLSTNSEVLETLNTNNTVYVYKDSLNHSRWYKIKTDTGVIGYVDKSCIEDIKEQPNDNIESEEKEKLIMFWQYGSSLDVLGKDIDGVDVVSPTWFSLKDDTGEVEINFSKAYYDKAKSYDYKLWPIITNGFDSGEDKKQATSDVLNDESKRETLILNIVEIIKNYNLDGINIDFESMKEADKYIYTQFIRELAPMVRSVGATLSVDIYFTNYIDRSGVGRACDYLMLMGYDQRGNWSNTAGSISEVSWVEGNIRSLIEDSKIDPSKIILGVPFYTRLWTDDSKNGLSTNVYSMKNSADFVNKYNLTKQMDEKSGQNFVEYQSNGKTYKLWIEDVESMERRADIVEKYNLAGIIGWQKGFETEDIWDMLKNKLK